MARKGPWRAPSSDDAREVTLPPEAPVLRGIEAVPGRVGLMARNLPVVGEHLGRPPGSTGAPARKFPLGPFLVALALLASVLLGFVVHF